MTGARVRNAALQLGVLATALAGGADAARINYQLELTALHSDNIDLSEDDEVSERVLVPRLTFDVKEEGAHLELQARGSLERLFYMDNEFPDENRGRFAGQLNWVLSPQRLHLVAEDYLSHQPINFRDGNYPGNLQRVNVFLVGPSLFARMGPATRFRLDLRAVESDAEESQDFDASRYTATASLQRQMSDTATGSVNLAWIDADLDNPALADYTRQDGFVRYEGRLRNVEYEVDLGGSRLDRDGASDESTGLARALVRWKPTGQSRLRFRARHQFSDEVQGLIFRLSDPEEDLVPDLVEQPSSLVTAGVYRLRHGEFEYRFTGDRAGLQVRPAYRRFRYVDRPEADRTERSATARASYRLGHLTDAFVSGSVRERDFRLGGEEQRDHVYSVGFERQLNRHWGVRAEGYRNERDSNVATSRYTENGVLLTVWWKR